MKNTYEEMREDFVLTACWCKDGVVLFRFPGEFSQLQFSFNERRFLRYELFRPRFFLHSINPIVLSFWQQEGFGITVVTRVILSQLQKQDYGSGKRNNFDSYREYLPNY